jgi:hypothetical protein
MFLRLESLFDKSSPRILSVVIAFNNGEERVPRLNRWSPKALLGTSRC